MVTLIVSDSDFLSERVRPLPVWLAKLLSLTEISGFLRSQEVSELCEAVYSTPIHSLLRLFPANVASLDSNLEGKRCARFGRAMKPCKHVEYVRNEVQNHSKLFEAYLSPHTKF